MIRDSRCLVNTCCDAWETPQGSMSQAAARAAAHTRGSVWAPAETTCLGRKTPNTCLQPCSNRLLQYVAALERIAQCALKCKCVRAASTTSLGSSSAWTRTRASWRSRCGTGRTGSTPWPSFISVFVRHSSVSRFRQLARRMLHRHSHPQLLNA